MDTARAWRASLALVLPITSALALFACVTNPVDSANLDAAVSADTGAPRGHDDGPMSEGVPPPDDSCDLAAPNACEDGGVCYAATPSCTGRGRCTQTGVCMTRAASVCGCDGKIYAKDCDAYDAGTVLAPAETCQPVDGHFPCGPEFCDPLHHYCQHTVSGTTSYSRTCAQLPSSCEPTMTMNRPDCGCLTEAGPHVCHACRVLDGPVPGLELDCPPPPN
jgi:hypothetical protein